MPDRIPQALQNLVQQEAENAMTFPDFMQHASAAMPFIPGVIGMGMGAANIGQELLDQHKEEAPRVLLEAVEQAAAEGLPPHHEGPPLAPGGFGPAAPWRPQGGAGFPFFPGMAGGLPAIVPPQGGMANVIPPQVAEAPPQVTQDHPTPDPRMAWVQELKPLSYREELFKQRDPEAWRKMAENRRDIWLRDIQKRESAVSRIRELIDSGQLMESTGEAQIRDLKNKLTPGEMTEAEREDAKRRRFDSVRAREDLAEKRRQAKIASRQEQAAQGQVPMNMMTMASGFIALGFPVDESLRFAGILANEGRAEQAAIIAQAREDREAALSALQQKEMEIRLEYLPESSELAIKAQKQDIKQSKERHEAYLKDLERQAKDAKRLAKWRKEDTAWKKQQAVIDNKLAQERIDMQRKQYEQAAAENKAAKETAYHESIRQAFNKQLEHYVGVGLTELVYYSYMFDENGNKRTREQVDQKMAEGGADQLSLKKQMIFATEAQTVNALQWTLINTPGTAVNKLWQKMKTEGVDTSLMGLPDPIDDDQNIWMQSPEHKNMLQNISPGASPARPKAGDAGFIDRLRGESGIA